ncbi:MAG: methyltransferase domain-containing protein, partial [Miltoncostaeaceae bacterium]
MVAEASTRLADLAPRVRVERQDLLELAVPEPVDLIFSTATLHWILDHERLFARLFAALAPGGRLVVQCGGAGNIASAHAAADQVAARAPYAEHFPEVVRDVNFADATITADRLRAAGFDEVRTWLHAVPADVGPVEDGALYLASIALRPHIARLPEELRGPFAREVAEIMLGADGHVVVDYVRLEIRAHRPPAQGGEPADGG